MILGLDLGITTGWCTLDDNGVFLEWGEVRQISSTEQYTAYLNVGFPLLNFDREYSLVIAEAPVIVGVSVLGRELQKVIEYFRSKFPSMITIGSGVWKTSNITSIELPEKPRSPHVRDAFFVAQWGLQKYGTTENRPETIRSR